MSDLRDAAAHADQLGFMAAAEGVTEAIASLNAIDPRPIIVNTGAVVTSKKGIDLTKETADFQATANKTLANRQTVDAPVFTPMSLGEATRHQILGAAMHGWILASAIDLLPLFFLILGFVLSREVWLNEQVVREKPTTLNKDKADREGADSLWQRNVLPFRGSRRNDAGFLRRRLWRCRLGRWRKPSFPTLPSRPVGSAPPTPSTCAAMAPPSFAI